MSDIPDLRFGGKMVRPERDNYTYTQPYGVVKSNINGTLSRLGRSSFGGPAQVTCTIQLNTLSKLQWWDDFYNYSIAEGSKRFNMELFTNGIIQTHVCQIVSAPKVNTNGWSGTVDLSLEAIPIIDRCAMASRLIITQCQGDYSSCYVDEIIELGLLLDDRW